MLSLLKKKDGKIELSTNRSTIKRTTEYNKINKMEDNKVKPEINKIEKI